MDILVLGGTQFIGRHIVDALTKAGHVVTVFTRGITPDPLPLGIKRLHGNRNEGLSGLSALRGRTWHTCVDVSGYTPIQVRASATALRACVSHYVYVSAVSVVDHRLTDPVDTPVTESHALLPAAAENITEINSDTYGPLKVACEGIVQTLFANRCTIVRPQVVAGEFDDSGRLSHWIGRAESSKTDGKCMLAPGDGSDYLQLIDVRDVANFIKTAVESNIYGIYNLSGHRVTWARFMQLLDARNYVWVSAAILCEANLSFSQLPLYRAQGSPRSSLMHVSCDAALAAGLVLRPLADTIKIMQDWLRATSANSEPLALSAEIEAQLVLQSQTVKN